MKLLGLRNDDVRGIRKEQAAVLESIEELELDSTMAEEKATALEKAVAQAQRRLVVSIALEGLDRLAEIAEHLDAS
jgi:UDP-N-acetylmuramyl tripeptide synthase